MVVYFNVQTINFCNIPEYFETTGGLFIFVLYCCDIFKCKFSDDVSYRTNKETDVNTIVRPKNMESLRKRH